MLVLDVKKREKIGKSSVALGKTGEMPAVVYGPKQEAISIVIPTRAFQKIWKKGGESSVIVLKGLGEDKETLIHDVDFDPVTDQPRHADFYAIEKGKKVKVGVPIEFVGTSVAVKELGAVLVKVLHELEIEVLPKDLPHVLEVDLSPLSTLGSQLLVKDVKAASGVKILNNLDDVIVIASEVKEEVVEVAPVDLTAIEVEKKGKKDEEGAGVSEEEAKKE